MINKNKQIKSISKEIIAILVTQQISFALMDWILDQCKEDIKLLIPKLPE